MSSLSFGEGREITRPRLAGPGLLGPLLRTARAHPDRTAVIDASSQLSYSQLAVRATGVAASLAEQGVEAGDRVGIYLDPGTDAAVGMVAALLLRAAYVPLDPEHPAARIAAQVRSTGLAACVSDRDGSIAGCPVIDPAGIAAGIPTGISERIAHEPRFDKSDISYVIHTSGSTGAPKGVQVEQRGVLNLLSDLERLAPVPPTAIGSWWTRPSFDVAVWEFWAPLCLGGTVTVVPGPSRLEARAFVGFLDQHSVHSAYVPAAFLPDLLDTFRADALACRQLRRMLVGVEPIALGVLQQLMRLRPELAIVNGYGPAETTVCCTLYQVPRDGGQPAERTPIGMPVTGNRCYLITPDGSAVPATAAAGPGELVVAGSGVARGYLGADAADASRFGPAADGGGGRAYRTGDLVRVRPDGNLVFEGRVDRQLKVRGFRVEPGEVEAALRQILALREVVVCAREQRGGGHVIAAYLVPQAGQHIEPVWIREQLVKLLPAHAVPTVICSIDQLPLTDNGKVDLAALGRIPVAAPPDGGAAPVDADWPLALVLSSWRHALGAAPINADDSFLASGGTSLAAAEVAAGLRQSTGRQVSAHDVLWAPSAEGLASVISRADAQRAPLSSDRLADPGGALSPAQRGIWVHDRLAAGSGAYHESICFTFTVEPDQARLRAAIASAVRAHPAFGMVVRLDGGKPRFAAGPSPVLLSVRRRGEADLDELLRAEASAPFDLATGPLIRCLLLTGEPCALLITWHHLVVDGWSARLFLRHLTRCYDHPSEVRAPSPVTIGDLNRRLLAAGSGADMRARAEAAARRLADLPALLPLARPGEQVTGAAAVGIALPQELVGRLASYAAGAGMSLAAACCAGYQRALAAVLNTDRFLLGCATGGRSDPDSEEVAGNLVNTVLLRCEGALELPAEEYAARAAAEFATALRDQEIPFPLLARGLLSPSEPRPPSFPQLYFSIDALATLTLGSQRGRYRPVLLARARFDVTLSLVHGPGRLEGVLEYRLAALSPSRAAELLDSFRDELAQLAGSRPATAGHGTSRSS
jgi:amino acid adenylation domain-containing protein